jgi:hypothetical protein
MKKDIGITLSYEDEGANIAGVIGVRPGKSATFCTALDFLLERKAIPLTDGKSIALHFMQELFGLEQDSIGGVLLPMALGYFLILAKRRRNGLSSLDAFAEDDAPKPKAPPPEDGEAFAFTATYIKDAPSLAETFGVDEEYMKAMVAKYKDSILGGEAVVTRETTFDQAVEFMQVVKGCDSRVGGAIMALASAGLLRRVKNSFSTKPSDILGALIKSMGLSPFEHSPPPSEEKKPEAEA